MRPAREDHPLRQPATLGELKTVYRQAIDYDNEARTAASRRARAAAQDRYSAVLLPMLRGARTVILRAGGVDQYRGRAPYRQLAFPAHSHTPRKNEVVAMELSEIAVGARMLEGPADYWNRPRANLQPCTVLATTAARVRVKFDSTGGEVLIGPNRLHALSMARYYDCAYPLRPADARAVLAAPPGTVPGRYDEALATIAAGEEVPMPQQTTTNSPPAGAFLVDAPLTAIDGDPANERPDLEYLPELLGDLLDSMRSAGLQERVKLFLEPTGRYRISSGHRRVAAARGLGWDTIPAVVEPAPGDASQQAIARIASNLCRKDIDPISLARGIAGLLARDATLTQSRVGELLGKSQAAISNALRLLELPAPVLELVEAGQLTAGHGEALLRIEGAELSYDGPTGRTAADLQEELARTVVRDGLSVSYLRTRVANQQSNHDYYTTRLAEQVRREAEAAAQAGAPAELTDAERARAAERQYWLDMEALREQRKAVAQQVVGSTLTDTGFGVLTFWQAVARVCVLECYNYRDALPGRPGKSADLAAIAEARNEGELLQRLAGVVRAGLLEDLGYDCRTFSHLKELANTLGLSKKVQKALKDAGLWADIPQAEPAAPATAAATPVSTPTSGKAADSACCANCGEAFSSPSPAAGICPACGARAEEIAAAVSDAGVPLTAAAIVADPACPACGNAPMVRAADGSWYTCENCDSVWAPDQVAPAQPAVGVAA